jgi:hypothetical protein
MLLNGRTAKSVGNWKWSFVSRSRETRASSKPKENKSFIIIIHEQEFPLTRLDNIAPRLIVVLNEHSVA